MIDTDGVSAELRQATIDVAKHRLLVTRLAGSDQESDLSEPVNCGGLGRIRHFTATTADGWPPNQLPLQPARKHLGQAIPSNGARAQVFQNAACNWRCWYCYVPFNLLRADNSRSEWVSAEQLVDAYLALPDRPPILDLSGGQPDLVPEWAAWTLRALIDRGVDSSTFLWSDDNLSNDYIFRYLSDEDLELLSTHPGYGRVGCLKGFDAESFAFNTGAAPELFERQLHLVGQMLTVFPDLHLYITLTTPQVSPTTRDSVRRLIDRLCELAPDLPARTLPLRIYPFTPTVPRMRAAHHVALSAQDAVVEMWTSALHDQGHRAEVL